MVFSKKSQWLGLLVLALALSGCDKQTSTLPSNNAEMTIEQDILAAQKALSRYFKQEFVPSDDVGATAAGVERIVAANNDFAFNMYQKLSQNDDNLLFSPYGLSSAMMLGYAAAQGQTYEEIKEVFFYPPMEEMLPNTAAIYNQLNRPNPDYSLASSNKLWVQQELSPTKDYLETVTRYLGAQVTPVDFIKDRASARQTINKAISEQTNARIPELLSDSAVNESTRNILTNALYFKGTWANEFFAENTKPEPFHVFESSHDKASVPTVDMMYQNNTFNYTEDQHAQVIELPYKGDSLSMMVILPKATDKSSMERLSASLTADKVRAWRDQFDYKNVDLYLPKFKLNMNYELAEVLGSMGMPTAFSAAADFSMFSSSFQLVFDKVIHQAVIEVDEMGTEAAETALVIDASAAEAPVAPIVFKADHPFIFFIYDKQINTVLFMGKMMMPPASSVTSD